MVSDGKCDVDGSDYCGKIDSLEHLFWWQKACIYQVLVQSFQDTNGDGKGDLLGIVARLDYFIALGVDAIWISPIYESPMHDMGDYRKINRIFGTLEDFELLVKEAHNRDLRIILDIALNHTSSAHKWFQESRKSRKNPGLGKGNWYFWNPGKLDENGDRLPPNNWESTFTGSAWEFDEMAGEFYLHIFGRNQPDLNWDCEDVRQELYSVLRFWLDKGVDGFRLDTMNLVSKTSEFPDAPISKSDCPWQPANHLFANGPHIHEYLQEMYEQVFAHYDCVTLAEMSCGVTPLDAFQHVELDCQDGNKWMLREWELPELKRVIEEWQETLVSNGGWNTVWMENHDQPRGISRFTTNSPRFRALCAKLLALWQFTLQGTNLIFQGQELGLVNPNIFREDMNQDIETIQYWNAACEDASAGASHKLELAKKAIVMKGRDNTRIPFPWTDDPHGGFCSPTAQPWIPALDPDSEWCGANQQRCPESVWSFYRSIIKMRRAHPTLYYGSFQSLDIDNPLVWAYKRRSKHACYLTVLNFSPGATSWRYVDHGIVLSCSTMLISNHQTCEAKSTPNEILLRPFEGRLYQLAAEAHPNF
ncbi:hypothetical protein N7462_011190 [Penicillium macrosclerotiorum]|uniref:uncharacterized protein n=1 Tax=Penicillium macrosclerotiorum TaxID=303699 RepID=UPI002546EAEB|nr:uncharacterized protein N7462_011190 [Penicillium macrosclerotiorum]KAJ5666781.1 hypothetical protein N7462_011190 [Penicillium macrosclerotiorum]